MFLTSSNDKHHRIWGLSYNPCKEPYVHLYKGPNLVLDANSYEPWCKWLAASMSTIASFPNRPQSHSPNHNMSYGRLVALRGILYHPCTIPLPGTLAMAHIDPGPYGSFQKLGILFWSLYVRDPVILGPHSRKLPYLTNPLPLILTPPTPQY